MELYYHLKAYRKGEPVGYYNGKAGNWEENLGPKAEAFPYWRKAAERKARFFNDYEPIHGLDFRVEAVYK